MGGRLPCSLEAGLIQAFALAAALASVPAFNALGFAGMTPAAVVALQGAVAAAAAWWRRMPWWWIPMHASFLPLAFWLHRADPPSWPFPVGFAILLGFYWSTYRTRVPLYLSGDAVHGALAEQLPSRRGARVIDIGAGFGGVLAGLERRRPDCTIHGIEIAPLTWAIGRLRLAFARSRCLLRRGDYRTVALTDYDVVFAFLSPAAMPDLYRQASASMRPGSLLVSCEFDVPGVPPDRIVRIPGHRRSLLVWTF
jgi:SAM-dependent methyltransferase